MSEPRAYRKMNGLGNDFVVIDARARALKPTPEQIERLADRAHGPGFDQLILIEPAKDADVFMRIFNADGSEIAACGNATRCVAFLLAQELSRPGVSISTAAGKLMADVESLDRITIDMGKPRFRWDEIPLAEPFHDTRRIELQVGPIDNPTLHSPSVVNVGNPHAIFWVEDVMAYDLARVGPLLEHHPLFPERANISLAHVTSPQSLTLRTWERGAGLTKACGTAACASAVAAARKKLTGRKVRVTLPGGDLDILWRDDDHILMTGPAAFDGDGRLDGDTLAPL